MACSKNQCSGFPIRQQLPTPPCMNTNCSSVCSDNTAMPLMESRMRERNAESFYRAGHAEMMFPDLAPVNMLDNNTSMPVGMAYVPWQQWNQTYPIEQAMTRGTLFPELDYPFVMGRCR
ncbi:MAG: spore coat associated protein CotJA [Lachnospiraceae bacterium]